MRPFIRAAALTLAAALCIPAPAHAQAPAAPPSAAADGTMLLTVFMKHDQSKTLKQINAELKAQGYFEQFPPPGVEVVSWYVVMGIGQVVTLRFPVEKLRAINVALENTAWGPYRTEFFATYDYRELAAAQKQAMQAAPK